jgi:hypothetical protein
MRRILIFAACLLATLAVSRADDSGHGDPLRAIATADSTEVHPDSIFEVTLSLQNLTNTVQKIKVPDCAWDRLWKSNNRRVTWDSWECEDKSESTVEISPGETYVFPNTLKMFVNESVKQSRVDFRMGFKTAAFKIVWSAPITLDVIP